MSHKIGDIVPTKIMPMREFVYEGLVKIKAMTTWEEVVNGAEYSLETEPVGPLIMRPATPEEQEEFDDSQLYNLEERWDD